MFHGVGDETVAECPATESLPASICVVNGHVIKRFTVTGRAELLQVFRGHTDDIICVKQHASRHLFTSSFDRTVIVWGLADGDILRRIVGFTRTIVGLSTLLWHSALGGIGRRLILNDAGGCVEVWDLSGSPSKTTETKLFEEQSVGGNDTAAVSSERGQLSSVAPGTACSPVFRYDTFHDHLLVLASDGRLHCLCPISGKHCGSAGDSLADWCRVDDNSFLFLHRDGSVESTVVEWPTVSDGCDGGRREHSGRRWVCHGECRFSVTRKWLWDSEPCPNSITAPTATVAVEFLCCLWLDIVVVSTALYDPTGFSGRLVLLDLTSGASVGVPGFTTRQPHSVETPAFSKADLGLKKPKATSPRATKWSTLRTGIRVAGNLGFAAAQAEHLAAEKASEVHEQALADAGWHRHVLFQKLNVAGLFLTGACVLETRSTAVEKRARCSFLLWDLSSLDGRRHLLERGGERPPAPMDQGGRPHIFHRSVAVVCRGIHRSFRDMVERRQRLALQRRGKELDVQINEVLLRRASRHASSGGLASKPNSSLRPKLASTIRAAQEARQRARDWLDDWERRKNPWRHETIDDVDSEEDRSGGAPDSLVDFSDDSDDFSDDGDTPLASHSESHSSAHSFSSQRALDNQDEDAAARQRGQEVLQLQQTAVTALDGACESLLEKNRRLRALLAQAADARANTSAKDLELLRLNAALEFERRRNADLKRLLDAKMTWHREVMDLQPRKSSSSHRRTASRAAFLTQLVPDVRQKLALCAGPQLKQLCSPLIVTTNLPFFRPVSHRRQHFRCAPARPLMSLHYRRRLCIADQSGFAAQERAFATGDRVVLLGVQGIRLESCVRLVRKRSGGDAARPAGNYCRRSIVGIGSSGVVTGYREVTCRFQRVYVAVAFSLRICAGQEHQIVLLVPSHRIAAFPALARRVSVSSGVALPHQDVRIPLTGQFQLDPDKVAPPVATGEVRVPKPARFLCGLHFVGIHTASPELTVLVQHDAAAQLCRVRLDPCQQAFSQLSCSLRTHSSSRSTSHDSDAGSHESRASGEPDDCLRCVAVHVGVNTAGCILSDHPTQAGAVQSSCCVLPLPPSSQSMRSLAHYNAELRGSDCGVAPCALVCLPVRPELVAMVKLHTMSWADLEPPAKPIANVAMPKSGRSRAGAGGVTTSVDEVAPPRRIAFFLVILRGDVDAWDEVAQNFFDVARGTGPGKIGHEALRSSYEEAWRKTWSEGGDVGQSPKWPASADGGGSPFSTFSDEELRRFYRQALFFAQRDGLLITCSAFGSGNSRIQFWNLATGTLLPKQLFSIDCASRLPVKPGASVCGALFRGCIYVGFGDGSVHAWRVGGEQAQGPLFSFRGNVGGVRLLLLVQPRTLVTASAEDHVICVWSSECGGDRDDAAAFLLRGHNQCIAELAVQGDFLVSIAHDATMRVWNLLDGAQVYCAVLQSVPTCVDARFASKSTRNGLSPAEALYLETVVGLRDGTVVCHRFFVNSDRALELDENSVVAVAAHDGPTSCVQFVGKLSPGAVPAATGTRCQSNHRCCSRHSYVEHRLVSCGLSDGRVCIWTYTSASAKCAVEPVLAASLGTEGLLRQICFDLHGQRLLACVSSDGGEDGSLLSVDVGENLCIWGRQLSTVSHSVTSGSLSGVARPSSKEPVNKRAGKSRCMLCRGLAQCRGRPLARVASATAGCRRLAFQTTLFVVSYVQLGCIAHASLGALGGGGSAAHVTVFGAKYSYVVWAIQTLGISTLSFPSAVALMSVLWVVAMLPCILYPLVLWKQRFSSSTNSDLSMGQAGSVMLTSTLQLACTLSGGLGQVLCISSIRAAVFLTQCDSYYSIAWSATNASGVGWAVPTFPESRVDSTTTAPQDPSDFMQSPVWTCQVPALLNAGYRQISEVSDCIAAGVAVGLFSNESAVSISNTAAQSVAGVDVAGCIVDAQGNLYFHDIPYDDGCQRCESAQGYRALCEWTSQTTESAGPAESGCMDVWAYNYDASVTVPDPAACVYDVLLRVASPHIECYGGHGAYGQSYLVQSGFVWAVLCIVIGGFYSRIIRVGGRLDAFEQLRRAEHVDFKVEKQSDPGAAGKPAEADVEAGHESLTMYSILESLLAEGDRLGDASPAAKPTASNIAGWSAFNWRSDDTDGLTFSADEQLRQEGLHLSREPTHDTTSAPLRFCSPHICNGVPSAGALGQEALPSLTLDRHSFSERNPFFGVVRVAVILFISFVQLVGVSVGGTGLNSTLAASIETGTTMREASVFLPDDVRWASVSVSVIQIAAVAVLAFVGSASVWWTVQPVNGNSGLRIHYTRCCKIVKEPAQLTHFGKSADFNSNATRLAQPAAAMDSGSSPEWLLNASLGRFWSGRLLNKIALGCDVGIVLLFGVNFVLHCLSLHLIETGTSFLNTFQPGGVSLAVGLSWLSFTIPSAIGIAAAAWPKSKSQPNSDGPRALHADTSHQRFAQPLGLTFESGIRRRAAAFGDLLKPVGPPPEGAFR